MLGNLTIIITTYKRYSFLKRLLSFYFSYKSDVRIIILDSTPYFPEDDTLIKILSHKNIDWRRYNSDIFFAHKIADGCQYINTEYAVLCADDDFLIPPSLDICINYLHEHLDYASAHGLYFSHKTSCGNKRFSLAPLYRDGISSEEETCVERVFSYLCGRTIYYPMYAVHRALTFKIIWSETKEYVSEEGLSELFPSSLSLVFGKMKILPEFYSSREPNYFSWDGGSEDVLVDKLYSDEKIASAVNGLSKHLCQNDSISIKEGKGLLFEAFQCYLIKLKSKYFARQLPNYKIFIYTLMRLLHKLGVRTRIKNIIYDFRYQGCNPSIYPKYLVDFMRVKESVLLSDTSHEEMNVSRKELSNRIKIK
jgi:glycosyltransferase domain-containing protein